MDRYTTGEEALPQNRQQKALMNTGSLRSVLIRLFFWLNIEWICLNSKILELKLELIESVQRCLVQEEPSRSINPFRGEQEEGLREEVHKMSALIYLDN